MASNVPECLIRFGCPEEFDKVMEYVFVERLVASDGGLIFNKPVMICWNELSAQAVMAFCRRNRLCIEAYQRIYF